MEISKPQPTVGNCPSLARWFMSNRGYAVENRGDKGAGRFSPNLSIFKR